MTLSEARAKVEEIRRVSEDEEIAHTLEDDLYYTFVLWIAIEGPPKFSEVAKEILEVTDIDFSRWTA
jgi:hypothetical protein